MKKYRVGKWQERKAVKTWKKGKREGRHEWVCRIQKWGERERGNEKQEV